MDHWLDRFLDSGAILSVKQGRLLLGYSACQVSITPFSQGFSFFFPDFFLNESKWMQFEEVKELSLDEFSYALAQKAAPYPLKTNHWQGADEAFFHRQYDCLRTKFLSGELFKAVPFVKECAEFPMSKEELVRSLAAACVHLRKNRSYLYGHWNQKGGILGLSPELLFHAVRRESLEVSTCACAGTLGRISNPEEFLIDPKERHEHQVVIDGIVDSLSPFGSVSVGTIELLKFGPLTHLVTPISASLDAKLPFSELLKALHPTPALGTFPRKAGSEWLKEYQKIIDRERYGAPVGYICENEASEAAFYVAIRNVQWNEECKYIMAGCGVVLESKVEMEWNEIQLKLQAIKEMLQL